ncbi:GDSL-type esterase/lipase family protein [Corynebacterium uberis]|uniref:GDSL-type esterase/lipase family protein n=1 Tax=Corynebacterium uberis TaxID=2883169 RepID=UPI001D0A4310|nr:GDSL-type esterase/lipase family protein [Corynebacterium uberis]UDL85353.1 GDSL-type esterase/lipase family protein [Corynebacterium uberis]
MSRRCCGRRGGAPTAAAAPGDNIVTFGDSYFANPNPDEFFGSKIAHQAPEQIRNAPGIKERLDGYAPGGCGHDKANIPARVGMKTGVEVRDYSCSGATMYTPSAGTTLQGEVDKAVAEHALDGQTKLVVIQIGFNDTYQQALTPKPVKANLYGAAADRAVAAIRGAAPNARIMFMNYPTISEPNTSMQCLIHVDVVGQPVDGGVPAFWIEVGEKETSEFAQAAAERNGGEFLDVRTPTANRHECTPDNQRIVAGVIDTRTKDYNLPVHLNAEGEEILANEIAARY